MGRSSIINISGTTYKYRTESTGRLHGPLRVACFCIFAVITPAIFIAIPLFMRFVLYGSALYHLHPSDMRIVDEKISTTWCKKQTIKANITFSAFDSDGIPQLSKAADVLSFNKTLIIPDDYKEYWGFYLLQGSKFKISACAKFKGGSLLIVQGRQHLDYCAYVGNLDSAQDSDQFSDSKSNERNPSDPDFNPNSRSQSQPKNTRVKVNPPSVVSSQEEMSLLLSKIRAFIKKKPHRYQKLKKKLFDWDIAMNDNNGYFPLQNETDQELLTSKELSTSSSPLVFTAVSNSTTTTSTSSSDNSNQQHHHHFRHEKSRMRLNEIEEHGKINRRNKRDIQIQKISESGENGAFEDVYDEHLMKMKGINLNSETHTHTQLTSSDSIWKTQHNLHSGGFNTSDPNDLSNSESESSYSSSEEALAKCEGKVALFYLKPLAECGNQDEIDQDEIMPVLLSTTVNVSGYYYFIIGSENEKMDNIMQLKLQLEKYEYELPLPIQNCTDVNHCELDLQFGSSQKLVISVPKPMPNNEDSSWDENYILESECEPRAGLYLLFVLCLPVMILVCAFQ